MVMVSTAGKTEEDTKANMSKIRSMVMVYMYGQMAGDTRVIGTMVNNTERVNTFFQMAL
jgi:hypothetical protein